MFCWVATQILLRINNFLRLRWYNLPISIFGKRWMIQMTSIMDDTTTIYIMWWFICLRWWRSGCDRLECNFLWTISSRWRWYCYIILLGLCQNLNLKQKKNKKNDLERNRNLQLAMSFVKIARMYLIHFFRRGYGHVISLQYFNICRKGKIFTPKFLT